MKLGRSGTLPVVSLFLILALVLPGCGSNNTVEGAGGMSVEKGAPVGRAESGGDIGASSPDGDTSSSAGDIAESETLPDDFGQKIVKTAELGINAKHIRESASDAQQIPASAGGSVLSSRISASGDSVYASLVLSVPSQEFEKTLDDLRSLGKKVTTDNVTGQDVTEEYVDHSPENATSSPPNRAC